MENTSFLINFFGWCSVLNIGILLFSTLFVIFFGNFAKSLHSKMFNIAQNRLDLIYSKYLGYYKLAILVFNLTPYFALKIMASS